MKIDYKINIRAVAQKAGVSTATVSRALNKKPNVSKTANDKVIRACEELGYQLNHGIQDLIRIGRGGVTRNISYVIVGRDVSAPTYARSLDGMEKAIGTFNYNLSLLRLSGCESSIYDLPPLLRDGRVDGIVLTGELSVKIVSLLKEYGKPIVILGMYGDSICGDLPRVLLDINASILRIVHELKASGKTSIAIFHERPDLFFEQQALAAYKQSIMDCGLDFDERLIFKGDASAIGNFSVLNAAFSDGGKIFDGLICLNHSTALIASHLIFSHSKCNGWESNVILATLWPFADFTLPVTTMYFDLMFEAVAIKATSILIDMLSVGNTYSGQKIELSAQRMMKPCCQGFEITS